MDSHSIPDRWTGRLDRRLVRVSWGVWGVILLTALIYAFQERPLTTAILAAGVIGTGVLPPIRRRFGFAATADTLLWILTLMLFGLALVGNGLRDAALIGYPALLMFAVMLRRFYTLWWLLGAQVIAVAALWGVQVMGWVSFKIEPASWLIVLNIISIVALTAWAGYLVSDDQSAVLAALTAENRRVGLALDQLDRATRHDALTGLPNRRAALLALDALCCAEPRSSAAVLLLNLDDFKSVNESLGPSVGDQFLVELAQRMQLQLAHREQVFRTGSDEFLVILDHLGREEVAEARAAEWLHFVRQPLLLAGLSVSITASGGGARFPMDGGSSRDLLLKADLALRTAKSSGRNLIRFYEPAMGGGGSDQLQMLADMRDALARGQFKLHFQPKFALGSGECCGAEALLRWHHTGGHWVSPGVFIPLAERSGLINELGSWVLRETCAQMARWSQSGYPMLPVAVNVSMVQFRKGDLLDIVGRCLETSSLPGAALELEITESLLSDSVAGVETTLAGLRQLGVSLAIDDFGTGYSNLGYLKRFDIQTLKIDQSFVRQLTHGGSEEAIVHAIVTMARRLGLQTVAEGVEDAPVAEQLLGLGCDMGQGFLWSKALPAEEFEARYLRPKSALTEPERHIQNMTVAVPR